MARGEVRYRIVADTSGFEKGISAARREFESFGKVVAAGVGLGAGFAVGEKAAEALIGAVKGVASAVVDSISHFAKLGSALTDMSAKTGLSARALQEFGFAAKLTGTTTEGIVKAVGQMQKSLVAGSSAYSALGLSVTQLKNMAPEKAFEVVGAAIKNLNNPTLEAAASMRVFGKAGTDVLPLLKEGLAAASAEAHHLGLVLSDEAVAAADALDDEVAKLKMAWEGLGNQFAAAATQGGEITSVVADLKEGVAELTNWVIDHKAEISAFFAAMADGARFAMTGVRGLLELIKEYAHWLPTLARMVPGGGPLMDAAKGSGVGGYIDAKLSAARAGTGLSASSGPVGTRAQAAAWQKDSKMRASPGFDPEAHKRGQDAARKAREANVKGEAKAAKEMAAAWKNDFWEANLDASEAYGKLMLEEMKKASSPPASGPAGMLGDTGFVMGNWQGTPGMGISPAQMNAAVSRDKAINAPGGSYEGLQAARARAKAAADDAKEGRYQNRVSTVYAAGDALQSLGVGGELVGGVMSAVEVGQRNRSAIKKAGGFGNLSTAGKIGVGADMVGGAMDIAKSSPGGAKGALGGAMKGASMGAAFGPWGMAVGAVAGALIGFFSGPKWAGAAKMGSKVFGFQVSDELAKAILASSKKLGVSLKAASLLNLDKAIAEGVKAGKDAGSFAPQALDLIKGIADKSIPAKEGILALGKSFDQIKDSAMNAGTVGDKAMVSIIQAARAAGQKVPEIDAFVKDQLAKAAGAMGGITGTVKDGKVAGGIQVTTPEGAAAQALVFSSTFWATVKASGLVAGVDAMAGPFDALKKKLETGGFDVGALLGPMSEMFDLLGEGGNESVRGALEGADALKTALEGVTNAGYLTTDVFKAYEVSAKDAFDQAIAGGLGAGQAYQSIGPLLGSLVEASRNSGIALDATTQAMVDQAKAAGVAFTTDPIDRMAAAIDRLVITLGGVVPGIENIGRAADGIPPINVPVNYDYGQGDMQQYQPTNMEGLGSAGGFGRVVAPKRVSKVTNFRVHPNEGVAVLPAAMMNRSSAGGLGSIVASMNAAVARDEKPAGLSELVATVAALTRSMANQQPAAPVTIAPQIYAAMDPSASPAGRDAMFDEFVERIAAGVRKGNSEIIPALEQQSFRRGA